MNVMMITLAVIISVSSAVFIDPSDGSSKSNHTSDMSTAWQYFNLYHPHTPKIYFNTDTHVYPKYEFEYAVSDKVTGDHKHKHEIRDGDRVRGEYSLIEPDGSLRNVQYNADHYNGFSAIVSSSVQKHGDKAISTFGNIRHFLPIGHGFKINKFLPNKNYTAHRNIYSNDHLKSKPVKETTEESFLDKNSSEISHEVENMTMAPKYEEHSTMITTDAVIPIMKMETKEGPLVEIMATETTTTDYVTTESVNNNLLQMSNNNDKIKEGRGVYEKNATTKVERKHLQQTSSDHSPDSEIGSSYYSRAYYVGF